MDGELETRTASSRFTTSLTNPDLSWPKPDFSPFIAQDIHFGSRRFRAPARRLPPNRHVFLLDIPPYPVASWLSSLSPLLRPVLSLLYRWWPEWFLPALAVLKERNPYNAHGYENEIDAYVHLRALQGTHVPRLLGEVTVTRPAAQTRYQISRRATPGVLLEWVDGVLLQSLPAGELARPALLDELRAVYTLLTREGVVHGDPRRHNFLLVGGTKIVAVDFEFTYPLSSDITNEDGLETLRIEIEKRERRAWGLGPAPLGFGLAFMNGAPVKGAPAIYD